MELEEKKDEPVDESLKDDDTIGLYLDMPDKIISWSRIPWYFWNWFKNAAIFKASLTFGEAMLDLFIGLSI